MDCENIFCVYEKEGKCILQNISLDISGSCLDCVYVNINKKYLNTKKKNLDSEY